MTENNDDNEKKKNESKSIIGSSPRSKSGRMIKIGMPIATPHERMKKQTRVGNKMSMEAAFTLHTKLACQLWVGRQGNIRQNKSGIVGVMRFAKEVGTCWTAAAMNNPVADYFLIRVEERYEKSEAGLKQSLNIIQDILEGQELFENIHSMSNTKPFTTALNFSCPWGWAAARLLKQYDELVRLGLTAKHMGLITDADWQILILDQGRPFRGFLASLTSFLNIPLDRDWYAPEFEHKLKKVRKHYGFANREIPVIPSDILEGKRRAKLSPEIKSANERIAIRQKEGFSDKDMNSLLKTMDLRKIEGKKVRQDYYKSKAKQKAEAHAQRELRELRKSNETLTPSKEHAEGNDND